MDAAQIELAEKLEIEIREIADGIEPCRRIGVAETGMLGDDDVEFLRQLRHAGQPDSDAAAAVQEQQRGTRFPPRMRRMRQSPIKIAWSLWSAIPRSLSAAAGCAPGVR